MMKGIFGFFVCALLLCACEPEEVESNANGGFLQNAQIGVWKEDGTALFAFDKWNQELGLLTSTRATRVQNENQEILLLCRLTTQPVVGESFTLSVDGAVNGNFYVAVKKICSERSLVWLWCDEKKQGFILFWE